MADVNYRATPPSAAELEHFNTLANQGTAEGYAQAADFARAAGYSDQTIAGYAANRFGIGEDTAQTYLRDVHPDATPQQGRDLNVVPLSAEELQAVDQQVLQPMPNYTGGIDQLRYAGLGDQDVAQVAGNRYDEDGHDGQRFPGSVITPTLVAGFLQTYASPPIAGTPGPDTPQPTAKPAEQAWATFAAKNPGANSDGKDVFVAVYSQSVAEGRSEAVAQDFAEHLMRPEMASVRVQLKGSEYWNPAQQALNLPAGGTTAAEVVTALEWKDKGWEGLAKFMEGASQASGQYVTTAAINKLAANAPSLMYATNAEANNKFGEKIATLSRETGQTFSQIMEKAGKGNLAAVGGVIESIGVAYQAHLSPSQLRTLGGDMLVGAKWTKAVGVATNNESLLAAAEFGAATGTMFQKWAQDDGGNRNHALTEGAASFVAGLAGGVGILTHSSTLKAISGSASSAVGLIAGWDANYKVPDLIKDGKWDLASGKGLEWGTHLAGNIVGGSTGEVLNNVGDLFGIGTDAIRTVHQINAEVPAVGTEAYSQWLEQAAPAEADVMKIGFRLLQTGFKFAGLEVPAPVQTIMDQSISYLSGPVTAEAVRAAGVSLGWFTHDVITTLGGTTEAAQTAFASISDATGEGAGRLGDTANWAGVAIKAGFWLADVFDKGMTNENGVAGVNLGAAVLGQLAGGGAVGLAITLPLAALTAFMAAREIVSTGTLVSFKAVPGQGVNLGMPGGGGDVWFPSATPSSTGNTGHNGSQTDTFYSTGFGTYGWTGDGIYVGVQGGNVTANLETSLGQTQVWLGSFPEGTQYLDQAKTYFEPLRALRNLDGSIADALNQADQRHGETEAGGTTVLRFLETDSTPDNPTNTFALGASTDLKTFGQDFPKLVDLRFDQFSDRMASTGTQAGTAFNAWFDLLASKSEMAPGERAVIADLISQKDFNGKPNPLLDMSPETIHRIGEQVSPGKLQSVADQAIGTAVLFGTLKDDAVVKGLNLNDDQILKLASVLSSPA